MCSASLNSNNPVSTAFGMRGVSNTRIINGLAPQKGRISSFSGLFRVGMHCFRGATRFVRGVGFANDSCSVRKCLRCNTYGSRGYLPPARIPFGFSNGTTTATRISTGRAPTAPMGRPITAIASDVMRPTTAAIAATVNDISL